MNIQSCYGGASKESVCIQCFSLGERNSEDALVRPCLINVPAYQPPRTQGRSFLHFLDREKV